MNEKLDWIAVDWGSTRIRAVALGPEGVIAAAEAARPSARDEKLSLDDLSAMVAGFLSAEEERADA